ncbi:hypothetical protein GXB85_17350 [Cellulomonas sp. APG4]|uniref:hypothetical protein n=1 Tax=Cellulomonas sp. APG4 TaxID=1538656 RepID=UPI00137B7354|nr:hypothetical protein [Cellulomonas sp. APG4]NCT92702.1 hypothetical protein [Cellulomonas sp. APG4]
MTLMVGGTTLALAGAAALGVGVWDAVVRADALDDGAYAGEAVELAPQNEPTSLEGLYTELNTALATRDREAFFAHVEGDAVEPLTLWWDNMDALGWSTGVLAPYTTTNLTASGPQTEVYVTLGTDLTFPQHRPALSNGAVAGLVTFSGDYVMVVDTTGPRPVVSDWASGETVPWDTEPLVVVERDGVVVAGGADELAHLEVVADAAVEPSRWLRADQAARRGGEELGGFVVFATQDADRFAGWWGEGSDEWTWEPAGFARSGILPTAGTPGMDPQLATGSTEGGGVTFVGPEAGVVPEDLEVILVHEFAHVLQYVETPSAARSVPLSTSEGWASYQELRYVMGGEYPDDEPWFGDYLGECVEGEPTLPTDRDFEGDGADCAYLVSSTLFGFVEEEGADPLAVADRAARDGVTVFGGMQRLGTPVSDDAWSSWVAEVAD